MHHSKQTQNEKTKRTHRSPISLTFQMRYDPPHTLKRTQLDPTPEPARMKVIHSPGGKA